jgi:hypothetical protein
MSISTFAEVKTAIANWLARSDLTSRISEFVALAESRIAYGADDDGVLFPSEAIRIRAMEVDADITINARTATLPTGYLEGRRFYIDADPIIKLDYQAPADFWTAAVTTSGKPSKYTVEGENLVFGPLVPDSTYAGKLLYYKKFTALSADADTNWLIANAPQIYVYGALLEAAPFIRNDSRLPMWHGLYKSIANGLNRANDRDRYSGAPLVSTSSVTVT